MDEMLDRLDPEQQAVARTTGGPVAVIAGAGTGKTACITARLAYAAQTGAIDPRATLALTFTTTAAAEVRQRLARLGIEGVQSRTFHSASLRQAQFFWPEVYGLQLPKVADSRLPLLGPVCERLGVPATDAVRREIDAEIAWCKQCNVVPEAYVTLARAAHRGLAHLEPEQVVDAIVAYEQAKQAACVIDLDDLLLCTVALLATEPAVARRVRTTYRHFVFDEFQDISPVQARLVELWLGGRSDICVVGDPAQTIHGFAGSRSHYLRTFAATHPGTTGLELTRNYRSTPPIVACANQVTGTGLTLTAHRTGGEPVEYSPDADPGSEARGVAQWLARRHADGLDWPEQAVLVRTRAEAETLTRALVAEAVPVGAGRQPGVHVGTLHAAKGREWEAVALAGLHDGALPHPLASTTAQLAEERRLLYVGVTRAKSWLRLSWPSTVGGRPAGPSRFLALP